MYTLYAWKIKNTKQLTECIPSDFVVRFVFVSVIDSHWKVI